MALALYMDVQIPRAITDSLRLRGVDVLTAQEDGARQLSDGELLDRAHTFRRVLSTFDDDFLVIATHDQREAIPFSGVIYAYPLTISVGACIRDLELVAKVAQPGDLANRVDFLPLRR